MINKVGITSYRTFKNFGHKRQPVARVTTIWHGFLTFTFIGLGIEWKRLTRFFLGSNNDDTLPSEPVNPV